MKSFTRCVAGGWVQPILRLILCERSVSVGGCVGIDELTFARVVSTDEGAIGVEVTTSSVRNQSEE
jgi:hypothetical protein